MKFSISSNQTKLVALALASFITACSDSTSDPKAKVDGVYQAAIASNVYTKDGASDEISLANTLLSDDKATVDVDESLNSYDIVNGYAAGVFGDISVASYGKSYYRIAKFGQDNITKYSFENPNQDEWQFTVNDEGKTHSNPYDILFVNEEKAYVIRYGSDSIWIIDPSVSSNDEAGFKIGEIDLSAYNPADSNINVPSMNAAVLDGGLLYVTMQVMHENSVPGDAKLAIINTTDDLETASSGITLKVKNPNDIHVQGNFLYVSGVGKHEDSWVIPTLPAEYTGGIEKIDVRNLTSKLIVDDGDSALHPYGQINGLALISETIGYFRGFSGWSNESLYRFNPSTGVVESEPVTGFSGVDIRLLSASPNDKIWVGINGAVNPEIQVLDPVDNSIIATMYTDKIPSAIAFSGNLSE